MLDLNITTLIQMVNFFIALYVLNILLIRPVRGILQERREKMDGLSKEAGGFEHEAQNRIEAYQAELARARQEGVAMRDAARSEGAAKQQEIVGEAGRKAQAELAAAQSALRAEAEKTLAELQKQVKDLAGKLATRVMS